MVRPSPGSIASVVSRASEWVVLLFLLLAATPPILFRHQSLTSIPKLNLLDGSWLLDTSFKAAGGIWFGRDVAFTYGPLFQWLSAAPSRWIGVSTGAIYATWYTLPFYLIILGTFLTVRLLLPEAAGWRRALLLLLAIVYWSPSDVRVSLCLPAFAIFVRLTDAAAAPGAAVLLRALAAAVICAGACLISVDTGLYSVAALLLCLAATAVGERGSREMVKFLLAAAAAFGVVVLVINGVMFSPLDFRFWRSNFAIANGYRWFEPIAMAKADKHLVIRVLLLGLVVFAVAAVWPRLRRNWTARAGFLLAGFCLAIVMLQNGLVRSDHGHVLIGIYPMVFFCGVIVVDRFNLGPLSAGVSAVGIVIVTLVVAAPCPMFRPGDVLSRVRQIRTPVLDCPEGSQLLDQACFSPSDAQLLTSVSGFVNSEAKPKERISVFPYQTAFGVLSRRQLAGGVMQGYLANGPYLTGLEIRGLQNAKPGVALYLPDGLTSEVLDGVPNFTRNPELWLYYLRHYRSAVALELGTIGLLRDDRRGSRVLISSQPIGDSITAVEVRRRSTTIDLGPVRWPSEGADFLKLRLRVDYPWWWRLRKPSCLTLQMFFADGSQRSLQFVLEPNHITDIWVFPWDGEEMGGYFAADEVQWRTRDRPLPTEVKVQITPFDWISVVPNTVAIESIEAIRVDLQ